MTSEKPSFFKVFVPEFSANKMLIPPPFTQILDKPLPENVVLRDYNEKMWLVDVAESGNKFYFKDGWTKFVKANSLVRGDIVIFEYFCEALFDVKIIVKDGFEKNRAADYKSRRGMKNRANSANTDIADENNEEDSEDTEIDDDASLKRQKNAFQEGRGGGQAASGSRTRKTRRRYRKSTGPRSCTIQKIFKYGLASRPKNPYFAAKILKGRADLQIPGHVIRDYNLDLPEQLMILDPKGRGWSLKYTKWTDGRVFYSGGWKSFCRVNFIEEGDVSICEFILRDLVDLYIKVSTIVRADDIRRLE